jgi:hypothetical protein
LALKSAAKDWPLARPSQIPSLNTCPNPSPRAGDQAGRIRYCGCQEKELKAPPIEEIKMMNYGLPHAAHLYAQSQRNPATELFSGARIAGQRRSIWASLTRRSSGLRILDQVRASAPGARFGGRRQVRLNDIRGTEGRAGDFDDQFHPLTDTTRQRWQSVATAMEAGLVLPPVQLIQVGDDYYVRDGHHRVSVARALGQDTIEAEVTVWSGNGR